MRSIPERLGTGIAVSASIAALALSAAETEAAPSSAHAQAAIPTQEHFMTPQPMQHNVHLPIRIKGEESSNCVGKRAVALSLRGPISVHEGLNPSKLVVRACKKSLQGKRFTIFYENDDTKPVSIQTRLKKPNKIAIPVHVNPTAPGEDYKPPILKAKVYQGKKLVAKNRWLTTYRGNRKPPHIDNFKHCTPDPNFAMGIQDDNEIIHEESGIPRVALLKFAWNELKARVLRVNAISGELQTDEDYADITTAVRTAKELGYRVLVTIMQTPTYLPTHDQAFSARYLSPEAGSVFAGKVMKKLGTYADYVSILNEPNHEYFNINSGDINSYLPVYNAMYPVIFNSPHKQPGAKILTGELAPSMGDINSWVPQLNTLPNDGVAIHSYWISPYMRNIIRMSRTPVYVTEQGNFAGPNQAEQNRIDNQTIKCSGAGFLIQYQLIQRGKPWDTAPFSLAYVRDKVQQQ